MFLFVNYDTLIYVNKYTLHPRYSEQFTITGIHYKGIQLDYKLRIGAEKPVHNNRVFTVIEFTINRMKCRSFVD
jgi:hypothetical protein